MIIDTGRHNDCLRSNRQEGDRDTDSDVGETTTGNAPVTASVETGEGQVASRQLIEVFSEV